MFTAAVVLTVTVGIAQNATIFTVVNAVMIRSLPYSQRSGSCKVPGKNEKLDLRRFGVRHRPGSAKLIPIDCNGWLHLNLTLWYFI